MNTRVGVAITISLLFAACEQRAPEPPKTEPAASAPQVIQAVPVKPDRNAPYAEKPILGSVGQTTCVQPAGEMLLGGDNLSCMSLLYTSIKAEDAAKPAVKLARMRAAFYQPGPRQRGKTIGWITYDVRIDCDAKQGWMLGDVQYDPEGGEIMKEAAPGGAAPIPAGGMSSALIEGVCIG